MPTMRVPPPLPPPPPRPNLSLPMMGVKRMAPAANVTKILGAQGLRLAPAGSPKSVLPVRGAPTLLPAQAQQIAAAAANGDPGAQSYVLDIIGAARGGSPQALGDAHLMTYAQKVEVQAKYVRQWVGPQAAARILTMAHYAIPVSI